MSPARTTPSALLLEQPSDNALFARTPGLELMQASSSLELQPQALLAVPPAPSSTESSAAIPEFDIEGDDAVLVYELKLVTKEGVLLRIGGKKAQCTIDGYLDPTSLVSGTSSDQLRHLVQNVIAEPFLRRAVADIEKRIPQPTQFD